MLLPYPFGCAKGDSGKRLRVEHDLLLPRILAKDVLACVSPVTGTAHSCDHSGLVIKRSIIKRVNHDKLFPIILEFLVQKIMSPTR